jgi:regulator of protease activity HflC (stomatin/prohibitin superfamily)
MSVFDAGYWFVVIVILVALISGSIFIVRQQSVAIIERFGRFHRIAGAGLWLKIPLVDRIVHRVSLRVQQLLVEVETKTKDDVFANLKVAVQYRVIAASASDSFYQLQNPASQIQAYVLDVVRARVPSLKLDEAFEKKDEIAEAVRSSLSDKMRAYGFEIPDALVTDIDPADQVKHAMNEIQAQERLRIAAQSKGEANKILVVKEAEANAESKRLQGEGIAKQRRAIIEGLQASVSAFAQGVSGATAQDAMSLVLLTQYFDMMRDVGVSAGSKVILTPHSPAAVSDLANQLRDAIVTGNEATNEHPQAHAQPQPHATPDQMQGLASAVRLNAQKNPGGNRSAS